MSRQYAVRDRDGTIHDEASRSGAMQSQRSYGGMVVTRKPNQQWHPYKRHRVFLWIFLAVQVAFIIWLIAGGTTHTGPSSAEIASLCGNGKWSPLYSSYGACVADTGKLLGSAGDVGKGIGIGLIVIIWVIVDFLLAVTYGIYRLARR